jgi:hypothetical protein
VCCSLLECSALKKKNASQLVENVKKYQHLVHDLEERLRGFVGAASRLAQMGESMAQSADKVCYTSGLSEQAGKSIDCDPMKSVVESFKERCERVRGDISILDEEIKTIIGHVEERNKAGAHYEKERSKADKLEGKHDAKASVARSEADRACDAYRQVHDRTLSELQNWKSNAASRYEPIHSEVSAVMASLFGNGTSSSPSSYSKPAAASAAVASSPVKMVSPVQPQPVDNYSAPVAAPAPAYAPPAAAAAPASLGTAIAQWDFTAETPEEVSFKAGDVLDLVECVDGDEWWKVRTASGAEGLAPSAYVSRRA